MTEKKESTHFVVPFEISRLHKHNGVRLGLSEKMLYSYLRNWQTNNKSVYPSYSRIMEDLGIGGRSSLSKYLNKLIDAKLLEVLSVTGSSNCYKVLDLHGNKIVKTYFKADSKDSFETDSDFSFYDSDSPF